MTRSENRQASARRLRSAALTALVLCLTTLPSPALAASVTTTIAPSAGGATAPSAGTTGTVPPATVPTTPTTSTAPAQTTPTLPATPTTTTPGTAAGKAAHAGSGGGVSGGAIVAAVIAALIALACLVWAVFRLGAFEPHWLLSARHSLAEAGFRASATWAEFKDWVRLGH